MRVEIIDFKNLGARDFSKDSNIRLEWDNFKKANFYPFIYDKFRVFKKKSNVFNNLESKRVKTQIRTYLDFLSLFVANVAVEKSNISKNKIGQSQVKTNENMALDSNLLCTRRIFWEQIFTKRIFLELVFVNNAKMRAMNAEYMGSDYATDVLSFPLEIESSMCFSLDFARESKQEKQDFKRDSNLDYPADSKRDPKRKIKKDFRQCIGSIVLNVDVAGMNAVSFGHNLFIEISTLFIHGLLHLLGFDHENDSGEQRDLESRILDSLHISHNIGLIQRADDRGSKQ